MRNPFLFCLTLSSVILGFSSCNSADNEVLLENDDVKKIYVTIEETDGATTRTVASPDAEDADKVHFTIGANEALGIFPSTGTQLYFSMTGTEGTEFSFDGGGWGLKKSYKYAAYMPFNKENYENDNKTIPLVYTGQLQTQLNNTSHLGAYDYQASAGVSPGSDGNTYIQLKRQSAIIVLKLSVPVSAQFVSATISTDSEVFVNENTMDISGSSVSLTAKSKSRKFTLFLDNLQTSASQEFRLYLMAGTPVNLSGAVLKVGMKTASGDIYVGTLASYYPTDASSWGNNGRYCYSSTLEALSPSDPHYYDPEYYVDQPQGTTETPSVTIENPGEWQ